MALKYKYKSKEEIPAEQAALYAEREGEWVLDCDGVADKTMLDEFRSNNVALIKQVEELKKRYEGIDPMQEIVDLVAGYWARTDQAVLISCLKGCSARPRWPPTSWRSTRRASRGRALRRS